MFSTMPAIGWSYERRIGWSPSQEWPVPFFHVSDLPTRTQRSPTSSADLLIEKLSPRLRKTASAYAAMIAARLRGVYRTDRQNPATIRTYGSNKIFEAHPSQGVEIRGPDTMEIFHVAIPYPTSLGNSDLTEEMAILSDQIQSRFPN